MDEELFCRLYVTCAGSLDDVAGMAAREAHLFAGPLVDVIASPNDGYAPGRGGQSYDCIDDAQFEVEVVADVGPSLGREEFEAGVVGFVTALRKHGWFVTVSGDFEDRVVSETGWNWTRQTPNPPGWSRQ
ncbi:MAG: hypothetical protein V4466_16285 [Pseudomonadota bacterium]